MREQTKEYMKACEGLRDMRKKEIEFLKEKLVAEKNLWGMREEMLKEGIFDGIIDEDRENFENISDEIFQLDKEVQNIEEKIHKCQY